MNSKKMSRSLLSRLRVLSPIQTICLTTAVVVTVYFVSGLISQLMWSSPLRPNIKMGYLPQEEPGGDPCDCEERVMKELMRGPLLPSDKRFIKLFKKHYLVAPSKEPYNLADETEGGPDDGLSDIVLELLNQKREGFFIESRVKLVDEATSKFVSNTLHLEKEFGWEGVILEPDERIYKKLQSKNRKAYLVPAAISATNYPQAVGIFPDSDKFTEKDYKAIQTGRKRLDTLIVQGIPLTTIIRVFKVKTIDYLSLSVQGREFEVLGTIPWDKVKIQVLTVEHMRHAVVFDMIGNIMQQKGYIFISSVIDDRFETSIYAHPALFE